MSALLLDLRLALRSIRSRPGFALAVALCIGLGIGVNTTAYSMLHAIVLRPLPYAGPDALVAVQRLNSADGRAAGTLSLPNFADLAERAPSLSAAAAYNIQVVNLTSGEEPASADAGMVTGAFFDVLGVRPQHGRTFTANDARRGSEPTVVIGHELWQARFAADPAAIGQALSVDGVPRTVIGVMPAGFAFTMDVEELWLPVDAAAPGLSRAQHTHRVVARLAPGATLERADAELRAAAADLALRFPESNEGVSARAVGLQDSQLPPNIRAVFVVMFGAVTFVLLIACANVANLMLSRTVARSREMAIRTSLGASRLRIARQLLTESVLLALMGAVLGVALASWGLDATLAALPAALPPHLTPRIQGDVLVYTTLIAVVAGLLFGLAPALQAGRADPQAVLKDGSRGSSAGVHHRRLRDVLVAGQLALSLVLLVGATLMTKSFLALRAVDPGFAADGVLAVKVYAGGDRYSDVARRIGSIEQLHAALGALPGVRSVAALPHPPLSGWNTNSPIAIEGRDDPPSQQSGAETRMLLGDYFETLRIGLRAGRTISFAEALDTASRVAVINEWMARQFWPEGDAIGSRVSVFGDRWFTVVGITADVKQRSLGEPPTAQIYLPYAATASRTMTFLLRTDGDPLQLAVPARRAVTSVDAGLAITQVDPLAAIVRRSLWEQRVFGALFGAFALAALLLASVGLYGVIAYATSQRSHEIGVRMALGARIPDVYRLVLGHGGRLVVVSLTIGIVLSLLLTRALASMLHGVSPTDAGVFVTVTLVLAAVAMLATWLPARRASHIDPAIALRNE